MGLLKLLKILVNKILLSPIRENIKCPKALPRIAVQASDRRRGHEVSENAEEGARQAPCLEYCRLLRV